MTQTADLLTGERESTIVGMAVARAWRDPDYKERLLRAPKLVLEEEGLEVPPEVDIRFVADTPEVTHVVLPETIDRPEEILPILRQVTPLAGGEEIRMLQNTPSRRTLVITQPPAGTEILSEQELSRRAARAATSFLYVANVEAEISISTTTDVEQAEVVVVAVGVAVLT